MTATDPTACPECSRPLAVQADYDCPCEGNPCVSCDGKCWRAENQDVCWHATPDVIRRSAMARVQRVLDGRKGYRISDLDEETRNDMLGEIVDAAVRGGPLVGRRDRGAT